MQESGARGGWRADWGFWRYAVACDKGIRMTVKRKSHNLDEALLRRAKRVLGATTETEAIHDALRAVLIGEDMVADLEAARGKGVFRPEFVRQMQAERRRAR
jgi:Arc/MetJ family transcription regulator